MGGFSIDVSIPVMTVFLQGVLSFFSPCVLPLVPVYIGYLSGGGAQKQEDGSVVYPRAKVFPRTVCFVLGVSFAFFLLGMGMSALTLFFRKNQLLLARAGGLIVILFGLYQLGLLGKSTALSGEYRLPIRFDKLAASPVTALLLGFFFSFAWTPCVGPTLASVLLIAGASASRAYGFLLIGVYTAGFCIPFLLTGWFTTTLLAFFKAHRNAVRYTVRAGGVLMILMGILMVSGRMNTISSALARY